MDLFVDSVRAWGAELLAVIGGTPEAAETSKAAMETGDWISLAGLLLTLGTVLIGAFWRLHRAGIATMTEAVEQVRGDVTEAVDGLRAELHSVGEELRKLAAAQIRAEAVSDRVDKLETRADRLEDRLAEIEKEQAAIRVLVDRRIRGTK